MQQKTGMLMKEKDPRRMEKQEIKKGMVKKIKLGGEGNENEKGHLKWKGYMQIMNGMGKRSKNR